MVKATTKYCPRCFEAFDHGGDTCPDHELKLIALEGIGEGLEGDVIDDKYEVIDVLGKGGMGTVYLARHMIIGREVALKVLRNDYLEDHKGVARFVREARAASKLKSRYSAMLHDFGLAPKGFLYYTMELATGRLLSDIIDREGAIGPERAMHIAADICHSLSEAHANDIVHRDIKADNIMISQDTDGHEIGKVLDFGTAKLIDTRDRSNRVTDPGIVCGTPEYMSPEQAQAKPVDGRSDLYSLGVLLFEMLTGKLPFTAANSVAVLLKHVNDEPPSPRSLVPTLAPLPGLESLISRLLAKDVEERPRTAVAVLRELQKNLVGFARDSGGESVVDLSAHAAFELEAGIEEAYRVPRGNTLISMMESPTAPKRGTGSRPRAQNTMEIAPGNLWREKKSIKQELDWGEVRSPTAEEEEPVVDTVHFGVSGGDIGLVDPSEAGSLEEFIAEPSSRPAPSSAVLAAVGTAGKNPLAKGDGEFEYVQLESISVDEESDDSLAPRYGGEKLRELPSEVLRGVEEAAGRVQPDRSGVAKWVITISGVVVGAGTLLLLYLNGALTPHSHPDTPPETEAASAMGDADIIASAELLDVVDITEDFGAVAEKEEALAEPAGVSSVLSAADRALLEKQEAAPIEPTPAPKIEPELAKEAKIPVAPAPGSREVSIAPPADVIEDPGSSAAEVAVPSPPDPAPVVEEEEEVPAPHHPRDPPNRKKSKKKAPKKQSKKKKPPKSDSGGFNLDELH